MIIDAKKKQALISIQSIIIHARSMAYDSKPHDQIAEVLDTAEYLAGLIYYDNDCTSEFEAHVCELKSKGVYIESSNSDSGV